MSDFRVEDEFVVNVDKELQLDEVRKNKTISLVDTEINSENYLSISDSLEPGESYRVQIISTSCFLDAEKCISYLRSQKSLFLGPLGLAKLFLSARENFPLLTWVYSFAKKKIFSKQARSEQGWTYLHNIKEGDVRLRHAPEGRPLMASDCFICVTPA